VFFCGENSPDKIGVNDDQENNPQMRNANLPVAIPQVWVCSDLKPAYFFTWASNT
jgi:hypothetical protein